MKKFIPKLLLLAGTAIAIASCSKKDSDKPGTDIVGKWSIASDTVRLYDDNNKLVSTEVNDQILPTDYVQFNQNGTGTNVEFGDQTNFTYTVNGTTLNIVTKSAVVNGVQVDGETEDLTIRHLDSHTLYTYEEGEETLNSTTLESKESIHFTK
jgi:hypothetical protein